MTATTHFFKPITIAVLLSAAAGAHSVARAAELNLRPGD